ncbi:hypothetical protein [Pseudochelatococcus sp.]|jgi:hypothetical protein|uniref:hypothetical protein n=1 Tax=Pseudochelatococcus sp. TaxID=2020869 RepID=UPI003D8F2338
MSVARVPVCAPPRDFAAGVSAYVDLATYIASFVQQAAGMIPNTPDMAGGGIVLKRDMNQVADMDRVPQFGSVQRQRN